LGDGIINFFNIVWINVKFDISKWITFNGVLVTNGSITTTITTTATTTSSLNNTTPITIFNTPITITISVNSIFVSTTWVT
jgi:hypothetical protein